MNFKKIGQTRILCLRGGRTTKIISDKTKYNRKSKHRTNREDR